MQHSLIITTINELQIKHPRSYVQIIKRKYPNIIKELNNFTPGGMSLNEKIYRLLFDINITPICKNCNINTVKYKPGRGYAIFCSRECCMSDKTVIRKRKETNIIKYGFDNPAKSKLIKDKIKETNIIRYGVEMPMQYETHKIKHQDACLINWGVSTPLKAKHVIDISKIKYKEIRQKVRLTNENAGLWRKQDDMLDYEYYKKIVIIFTNKQPITLLENYDKRGRSGIIDAYHLDHKYSIAQGFEDCIPAHIIGHISNLEMLPYAENCSKQHKCSISKDELFENYFLNS